MSRDEAYTLKEMLTEMKLDMREHVEKHERDMNEIKCMFSKQQTAYQSLKEEHNEFKTVVKTLSAVGASAWALITFIVPQLFK